MNQNPKPKEFVRIPKPSPDLPDTVVLHLVCNHCGTNLIKVPGKSVAGCPNCTAIYTLSPFKEMGA